MAPLERSLILWQRFAQLARYLPVLPVFGKGETRFQPVYAGDIGRLVEILTRPDVNRTTDFKGKIIEAAGPDSEFPFLFLFLTPSTLLIA